MGEKSKKKTKSKTDEEAKSESKDKKTKKEKGDETAKAEKPAVKNKEKREKEVVEEKKEDDEKEKKKISKEEKKATGKNDKKEKKKIDKKDREKVDGKKMAENEKKDKIEKNEKKVEVAAQKSEKKEKEKTVKKLKKIDSVVKEKEKTEKKGKKVDAVVQKNDKTEKKGKKKEPVVKTNENKEEDKTEKKEKKVDAVVKKVDKKEKTEKKGKKVGAVVKKNDKKEKDKTEKKKKKAAAIKKNDKKENEKTEKKGQKVKAVVKSVCCICLDENADSSAGGLCEHVFCLSCLENLLHRPLAKPQLHDNHLGAPTLGRCPECRTELRKFEMKDVKTGELKYQRNTNIKSTPIYGKVFRPKDKTLQLGNFHFDADKPYMNFLDGIEQDKEMWMLNDGTQIPEKVPFEDGCFYDETTQTFHGKIYWQPITFRGAHRWEVVLCFTRDFNSIHIGLIHMRKERLLKKMDEINEKELYRHLYPLDGVWKVTWKNEDDEAETGRLTVRNNEFQQGSSLFNLNFEEPEKPRFRWPLNPIWAAAKSGVNLKKKPVGPRIGEKIVWETLHPEFREIVWLRESIGKPSIQRTVHFGIGHNEYSTGITSVTPNTNDDECSEVTNETGWTDDDSQSASFLFEDDSSEDSISKSDSNNSDDAEDR